MKFATKIYLICAIILILDCLTTFFCLSYIPDTYESNKHIAYGIEKLGLKFLFLLLPINLIFFYWFFHFTYNLAYKISKNEKETKLMSILLGLTFVIVFGKAVINNFLIIVKYGLM